MSNTALTALQNEYNFCVFVTSKIFHLKSKSNLINCRIPDHRRYTALAPECLRNPVFPSGGPGPGVLGARTASDTAKMRSQASRLPCRTSATRIIAAAGARPSIHGELPELRNAAKSGAQVCGTRGRPAIDVFSESRTSESFHVTNNVYLRYRERERVK